MMTLECKAKIIIKRVILVGVCQRLLVIKRGIRQANDGVRV